MNESPPERKRPKHLKLRSVGARRLKLLALPALAVLVVLVGGGWRLISARLPGQKPVSSSPQPASLQGLLAASASALTAGDIALANLLCAEDLPGAGAPSIADCLTTLDHWTRRVRAETERNLHRFRENPAEYDHSEAYFRMLMMAVVVYEDFGVRYNPERITVPAHAAAPDRFFADSRDLFLHGLCGRRLGTCSSMPVLYVALGRRLGYPLKLVTTKSHLFLRWDSPSERFNLEATGKGMNRYDDAHFRQWPYPVSDEEAVADGYLKSLSPTEELALFLSLRGHCLKEAGRLPEAVSAYAHAARSAPDTRAYRLLLADAQARREPGPQPAPAAGQDSAHSSLPPPPPAWRTPPGSQPGLPPDPNPLRDVR